MLQDSRKSIYISFLYPVYIFQVSLLPTLSFFSGAFYKIIMLWGSAQDLVSYYYTY